MNEQNTTHWERKVLIGKGNLQKFSEDYDKINNSNNQFCTASQLFPVGQVPNGGEYSMLFEYCMYYNVNNIQNKQLNPKTGEIEQPKKKLVI